MERIDIKSNSLRPPNHRAVAPPLHRAYVTRSAPTSAGRPTNEQLSARVLPHWVNSSLTDGHAYVTYGSTIWELVGTRIQYKFEILVVFLVGMDII